MTHTEVVAGSSTPVALPSNLIDVDALDIGKAAAPVISPLVNLTFDPVFMGLPADSQLEDSQRLSSARELHLRCLDNVFTDTNAYQTLQSNGASSTLQDHNPYDDQTARNSPGLQSQLLHNDSSDDGVVHPSKSSG
jgi:hypothetical protein